MTVLIIVCIYIAAVAGLTFGWIAGHGIGRNNYDDGYAQGFSDAADLYACRIVSADTRGPAREPDIQYRIGRK